LELDILGRIRTYAPQTAVLCLTRRRGPAGAADAVVVLPPATPGANDEAPTVAVAAGKDAPAEAQLFDIVTALPPDTDEPTVDERMAEQSDEEPGLRSLLRPFVPIVAVASALLL